jgi:hypothetical protein
VKNSFSGRNEHKNKINFEIFAFLFIYLLKEGQNTGF